MEIGGLLITNQNHVEHVFPNNDFISISFLLCPVPHTERHSDPVRSSLFLYGICFLVSYSSISCHPLQINHDINGTKNMIEAWMTSFP